MLPFIIISTCGGLDVTTFREENAATKFCARMNRLRIVYEMEVY